MWAMMGEPLPVDEIRENNQPHGTVSLRLLCGLSVLFAFRPGVLIYPAFVLCAWFGIALLVRSDQLWREQRHGGEATAEGGDRIVPRRTSGPA